MNPRHPAVVLAVLTALTVPVALGDVAVGSTDRVGHPASGPRLPEVALTSDRDDLPPGTIPGFDGQIYDKAPTVVAGRKRDLYFGFELDYA